MQEERARRSNADRTVATRAALISAARELFVKNGYAETSTPEIVRSAGITRGALYHHFADKAALFRAVLEAEFRAVAEEIEEATILPSNAMDALVQGSHAYFRAMRDPERVRLMLLDGPAVLGRKVLEEIDEETSAGSLRRGLDAAIRSGEMRALPVGPLTALLSAMFDRAALETLDGRNVDDYDRIIETILASLKPEGFTPH